ncbi:hypothetical protein Bhyg_06923 [Pseudolycoriella hygida]|uniref:Uncharacterized protein n=1 Tax=Pseudolycoriella hygida TaxID=35572 RepID=A0A9Q0N1N7_9DIPT|nr:hypothetical protein Bhyg_06923 [Pseudolycoriella hygida]
MDSQNKNKKYNKSVYVQGFSIYRSTSLQPLQKLIDGMKRNNNLWDENLNFVALFLNPNSLNRVVSVGYQLVIRAYIQYINEHFSDLHRNKMFNA